ncbi:MAG: PEP-CTERM sorting domain-containing protein [Pseudomonadota bacterium]
MKKTLLSVALIASGVFAATSAMAAPYTVNTALNGITAGFDNVITATGSTVVTAQVVSGQNVYNYIDKDGNPATVTVTRPTGGSASPFGGPGSYSNMTGAIWDISPGGAAGGGVGGKADIPGFSSGLTFTFSSPVNAFGFEIGDWATCCMTNTRPADVQADYGVPANGSGLWIAFDGGAFTLPANALSSSDNPGIPAQGTYTNFIGAIDSSSFFSTITFFGDGFGEVLYAGGTLRFASVPKGSVCTGGACNVPEPQALALLGLGLLGLIGARARKAA